MRCVREAKWGAFARRRSAHIWDLTAGAAVLLSPPDLGNIWARTRHHPPSPARDHPLTLSRSRTATPSWTTRLQRTWMCSKGKREQRHYSDSAWFSCLPIEALCVIFLCIYVDEANWAMKLKSALLFWHFTFISERTISHHWSVAFLWGMSKNQAAKLSFDSDITEAFVHFIYLFSYLMTGVT